MKNKITTIRLSKNIKDNLMLIKIKHNLKTLEEVIKFLIKNNKNKI